MCSDEFLRPAVSFHPSVRCKSGKLINNGINYRTMVVMSLVCVFSTAHYRRWLPQPLAFLELRGKAHIKSLNHSKIKTIDDCFLSLLALLSARGSLYAELVQIELMANLMSHVWANGTWITHIWPFYSLSSCLFSQRLTVSALDLWTVVKPHSLCYAS